STFMRGRESIAFMLPLLFGLALRIHALDKQSLFLDEAFTADLILRPWSAMFIHALQDVHPLLYYIGLKAIITYLPLTEWTLRIFSALFSTLSIALVIGITLSWPVLRQ